MFREGLCGGFAVMLSSPSDFRTLRRVFYELVASLIVLSGWFVGCVIFYNNVKKYELDLLLVKCLFLIGRYSDWWVLVRKVFGFALVTYRQQQWSCDGGIWCSLHFWGPCNKLGIKSKVVGDVSMQHYSPYVFACFMWIWSSDAWQLLLHFAGRNHAVLREKSLTSA